MSDLDDRIRSHQIELGMRAAEAIEREDKDTYQEDRVMDDIEARLRTLRKADVDELEVTFWLDVNGWCCNIQLEQPRSTGGFHKLGDWESSEGYETHMDALRAALDEAERE